jgi:hypothetical protein
MGDFSFDRASNGRKASDRQREANRRNGRLGVGRKTERGRDASRLNAVKHGLRSRLPSDRVIAPVRPEFERLRGEFYGLKSPQGPEEKMSVDRIIAINRQLCYVDQTFEASKSDLVPDDLDFRSRTAEEFETLWKHLGYYATCRATLLKQLMIEELHLQRLQERRREAHASVRNTVSLLPTATADANSDEDANSHKNVDLPNGDSDGELGGPKPASARIDVPSPPKQVSTTVATSPAIEATTEGGLEMRRRPGRPATWK